MLAVWRHITLIVTCLLPFVSVAQPQLSWLATSHDFGTFMEAGGKVKCRLQAVNTGNEPVVVERVQASCGCTAVNYTTQPVAPCDTVDVYITYNPSGRPGQFDKQVFVFTNAQQRRSVLTITGNVIAMPATLDKQYPLKAGDLRISAASIPFGNLKRGPVGKNLFLSAYNASIDTLMVSLGEAPSHLLPMVVPDTVPPGRVTALTVHYLPAKAPLWGLNVDTLTLVAHPLHDGTRAHGGVAQVSVMAQIEEDFDQLTPQQRAAAPVISMDGVESLDFGVMRRGETHSQDITVTNKGKMPLLIRRVWVPDGEGITASADRNQVKRNKEATITVTVNTAQVKDNMLNTRLTIITNDPENPVMSVRLVGIVE